MIDRYDLFKQHITWQIDRYATWQNLILWKKRHLAEPQLKVSAFIYILILMVP